MTSLASFGGIEEPQVVYHPATKSFTSDSFVNITDVTPGTVQMLLRYSQSSWDGDRTTSNTDRGRAEVKTLGPNQKIHETYDYTTTWKTNTGFIGSSQFCYITQLKPIDGNTEELLLRRAAGCHLHRQRLRRRPGALRVNFVLSRKRIQQP